MELLRSTAGIDILSRPNWLAYQWLGLNQQVWAEVGFGMGFDPSRSCLTVPKKDLTEHSKLERPRGVL